MEMKTVRRLIVGAALVITFGGLIFALSVGQYAIALMQFALFSLNVYNAARNNIFSLE